MNFRFTLIFLLTVAVAPFCRADEPSSQAILNEVNLARTNPKEYARILESQQGEFQARNGQRELREAINFLNKARPLPPLELSDALSMGAMTHVMGQGATGGTGHAGADRSTPWDRIGKFGKWVGTAGENISYGMRTPRGIVSSLIVDIGVSNRGHRRNLFCPKFGVAGIATGGHARYGTMCVMDFAGGFIPAQSAGAGKIAVAHAKGETKG